MNAELTIAQQKTALRKLMRQRKAAVAPEQKQAEADLVFGAVERLPQFAQASRVLLYCSLPDELPTHRVLERWSGMKEVYLPRVKGDDLEIVRYDGALSDDNAFHIGEPSGEPVDFVPELVIVPAVALDVHCRRMGRGKGYYDRLLAQGDTFKVGVALQCQLVENVPCEPHDQPLDAVVTASQTLLRML